MVADCALGNFDKGSHLRDLKEVVLHHSNGEGLNILDWFRHSIIQGKALRQLLHQRLALIWEPMNKANRNHLCVLWAKWRA